MPAGTSQMVSVSPLWSVRSPPFSLSLKGSIMAGSLTELAPLTCTTSLAMRNSGLKPAPLPPLTHLLCTTVGCTKSWKPLLRSLASLAWASELFCRPHELPLLLSMCSSRPSGVLLILAASLSEPSSRSSTLKLIASMSATSLSSTISTTSPAMTKSGCLDAASRPVASLHCTTAGLTKSCAFLSHAARSSMAALRLRLYHTNRARTSTRGTRM
mmetsp:Transcript_17678/g.43219  ORF Transcript_17678/g.43219 Transcript_17678/m.43219 type:complete len:214 (+) Transcript_17678:1143-1784(+)